MERSLMFKSRGDVLNTNPLTKHNTIIPVFFLLICFAVSSCVTVRLIADYDEQIDKGITAFQRSMENHLLTLAGQIGTPAADLSNYDDFYLNTKVNLNALRWRAAVQPKNERTVEQLDILYENVELLIKMHEQGLELNDIPPLRNAFNVSATAILKLELAKKRGEK